MSRDKSPPVQFRFAIGTAVMAQVKKGGHLKPGRIVSLIPCEPGPNYGVRFVGMSDLIHCPEKTIKLRREKLIIRERLRD